jgi:hypothetical protein
VLAWALAGESAELLWRLSDALAGASAEQRAAGVGARGLSEVERKKN